MPPAIESAGARAALVITTAAYVDPDLADLVAPAQDAAAIAEVLADPAIGCFEVTAVLDRPEYEVRRAADAFLAGREPDDLVLVYLSCHGVLDRRGLLYFATTDTTKKQLSSTAMESRWLMDRMENCRARRQVLILDCCFSGSFDRIKSNSDLDLERRLGVLEHHSRGRVVLTASRAAEYSYEGEPLTENASAGSIFTTGLVEGLRTGHADRDEDGYVTVEDAFAYAADHVRARGREQSPQRWIYGGEGDIVLACNPNGPTVTPERLPESLRASLDSPLPQVRQAGVGLLGEWLLSAEPAKVLAAQCELESIAANDSPAVAAAARELLTAVAPPPSVATAAERERPEIVVPAPEIAPVTGLVVTEERRLNSGRARVGSLAFSPDGRLLAGATTDRAVRLWDPAGGSVLRSIPTGHADQLRSVVFSPDGELLATTSDDASVKIWNRRDEHPAIYSLTGHEDWVWSVAFSPDGRLLATAGRDWTVRLWDPTTGSAVFPALTGHTGPVHAVAFSPDGHRLASGSEDATVRLWDVTTGRALRSPLTGHEAGVRVVVFSPDGRLLASAGRDGSVLLWDAATGWSVGDPLLGHTGHICAIAFGPDSRRLATVGDEGTLRCWNARAGEAVGDPVVLADPDETIRSAAFAPDGIHLATSGDDVHIWCMHRADAR